MKKLAQYEGDKHSMKNRSFMNRNAIVVLLILVSLICLRAGSVQAQEREAKTAGGALKTISFGGNLPKKNTDSAQGIEEILKGDIIFAQKHNDRGIAHSEKGQYDLAVAEFDKSLEIYPSAETYNNRGVTYSKKGDLGHAIADFTKALEINPDGSKEYYNRGITYAIKGQFNLALLDLKKCLELDPTNAAAYDARGSILVALVCADWGNACQLGNCDHLRDAVKSGLCVAATGNSSL